jgi:hypothetical protein
MRCAKALLGATAAATASALFIAVPAQAEPRVEPIVRKLGSPLQVQAVPGGALVPSSNEETGESRLLAVSDEGQRQTLIQNQGFIGGFDWRLSESTAEIAFTAVEKKAKLKLYSEPVMGGPGAPARSFRARGLTSQISTLANLSRYEREANPDGRQTYGIEKLGRCEVPKKLRPFFEPYKGIVESNPYAVGAARDGGWFVADAAANAIIHVAENGDVSTAAVLPVQRIRINRAAAEQFGLNPCAVGKTMRYEPVPTDVEQAPNGKLFVSLLPGGEGPTATRGKVMSIDLESGKMRTFARGFVGATNVALAPGRIFVAELFSGLISSVDRDTRKKSVYVKQANPAAVDWLGGALYATTRVFAPLRGKLVKITETSAVD